MNEERMKILEMLSDGTINTEEAIKLLDSFTNDSENNYGHKRQFKGHGMSNINRTNQNIDEGSEEDLNDEDSHGDNDFIRGQQRKNQNFFDFAWVKDMHKVMNNFRENILEMESNIETSVDEYGFPEFFGYNTNNVRVFTTTSTTASQGINSIGCKAKNSKFELVSHDGNEIEVLAHYAPKRNYEPVISFKEENGDFHLDYDSDEVSFMNVLLKVPRNTLIKNIHIKNRNGMILIDDVLFENLEGKTTNSPIKITNVEGSEMFLESKNSTIKAKAIKGTKVSFKTSNSPIIIEDLFADEATLSTTNSTISCNKIDMRVADLKTSNGSIMLNNLTGFLNEQYPNYKLKAKTSMAKIFVNLPENYKTPYSLKATTSMSTIENYDPNFIYNVKEENYIDGNSVDYNNSNKKYDLELQTSYGKIQLEAENF